MKQHSASSKTIAVLLLAMISISTSFIAYAWLTSFTNSVETDISSQKKPSLIKIEHVSKLPSGGLAIYVRNIGNRKTVIDSVYVKDDEKGTIRRYYVDVEIKPHEVSEIIIPALELSRLNMSKVKIMLGSTEGVVVKLSALQSTSTYGSGRKTPTYICFQAFRSKWSSDTHWVIFDYISGKYWLYDRTNDVLEGPYVSYAPILRNTNEYTIATSWTSWSQRPIDSPVLIVINPTKASEDWVFTWHDPHGTWRFYLRKLNGDIEIDFLVFWEDIFNPYHPRSLDDWRDHVVRVTVFTNGTFRIAVFMAKGGYKHSFYLNVPKNKFSNIEDLKPVYVKDFGKSIFQSDGEYFYEKSDKIFYVKI